MSSLAQLSVRFKAFDHNCLVRAQKQLQSALSLCRPVSDESVRPLDSKSASGLASPNEEHERGLQATGFGFLDANPKVSLGAFLNSIRNLAQDPETCYSIVMLLQPSALFSLPRAQYPPSCTRKARKENAIMSQPWSVLLWPSEVFCPILFLTFKPHLQGIVNLPNEISRFTVLKGPHVHKKSREQFQRLTRTMRIELELEQGTAELFFKLLHNMYFVGCQLSVRVRTNSYLYS